ncbi:unnamed protein product [Rhizoctonia solani]|uniref:V-type proton ATPase proteolipid subunit n=1 Tax=Rhizoctonia solani TaxID=456999 RepID=A0A8H3BQC5_9AGAM|nr:unnamed protein product [Rhizoctonia solani]
MSTDYCPVYSPFFSALGVTSAIVFTSIGARFVVSTYGFCLRSLIFCMARHRSYGTAKSSLGISATSVIRPDLMVRSCIPVVMAGIIAIYGLVVSVVISDNLQPKMPLFTGVIQLGAGLSVGLSGLAAGFAIGIAGDAGVRGTAIQPRLFVGMVLILIFAEVLGLYGTSLPFFVSISLTENVGLIVALILSNKGKVRDVDALCPSSGAVLGMSVLNNQL